MRQLALLLLTWGAHLAAPAAAEAQRGAIRVELGVEPQQVTVGDPFRSAVRVLPPAGFTVRYLEFPSGDSVASTAPVQLVEGASGTVATYTLVAWAAGPLTATVPIEILSSDGDASRFDLRLQLPEVRSVLPAGEEEIQPRPPKGLMTLPASDGFPWWLLALLLLAVLLAYLAYRLLRRRPPAAEPNVRTWALDELSEERMDPLLRAGEHARIVAHASRVLRVYIERTWTTLGTDLTTTELLERIDVVALPPEESVDEGTSVEPVPSALDGTGASAAPLIDGLDPGSELRPILLTADRVKFARYSPSRDDAAAVLRAARSWIARFPPPRRIDDEARRAA